MEFRPCDSGRTAELEALFTATFSASEGPEEGRLIGDLVRDMIATVPHDDIRVMTAVDGSEIVASAVFTRMEYPEDERTVFILSPVAVATARQGRGVGQALLRHGLNDLRVRGVDIVLTYGDVAFYARVGFTPISERDARAPQPLQYPAGWLGQALNGSPLGVIRGPSRCVAPLARPELW